MAKATEVRDMSDDELASSLSDAKETLFNLRFQLVTGQLDNPMRIKQVRKEVARILTEIRARELRIAAGAAEEA